MTGRTRLGGISIDCQTTDLPEAARFWAYALGMEATPGGETFMRLGRLEGSPDGVLWNAEGLTVEVQRVSHTPRVHLDIEAEDVAAEVSRLEGLGATQTAAIEDWVVMRAPTGHGFCVVPWDDAPRPTPQAQVEPGVRTHRSRLGVLVIDCQTDDLGPATSFWAAALGVSGAVDADGKYAVLAERRGYPKLLLQSVEHEPRVHIDLETDDQDAEERRLRAIGCSRVARVKRWIVMEAPTGQRFCLVKPQSADFPGQAPVWES